MDLDGTCLDGRRAFLKISIEQVSMEEEFF
jgi:hypothetical protein